MILWSNPRANQRRELPADDQSDRFFGVQAWTLSGGEKAPAKEAWGSVSCGRYSLGPRGAIKVLSPEHSSDAGTANG